jgi:hypothetical protein
MVHEALEGGGGVTQAKGQARSNVAMNSSIVPDCFNFVKRPKWLVSVSKRS